ncbi:MAG: MSHA pilin protein MshB [Glaciecola sp.]|jgi:MSHA pilin protein MshB
MKHENGFTLIELIIVIVVLGILAVTALPRFLEFSEDANASVTKASGAAFISAVKLTNVKWKLDGQGAAIDNYDVFGSGTNLIDVNAAGWPVKQDPSVEASPVLDGSDDCVSLWNGILNSGSVTAALDTSGDFQATYATNNCTYTMVNSPDYSVFYNSNTGQVIIDSTL